jgi:hypothetical protein
MLRANEVLSEQEDRKNARMSAMRPVLVQIEYKIRQQAIHSADSPYILFEVPTFVFGYPLYTLKEAIEFLMHELFRAGYWVWNVDEKYLLISWIKPVKTRDLGKPITVTNYRPSIYDPTFLGNP